MASELPTNGTVIAYPYLWRWQRDKGETEGRKERPVCLMLAIPKGDETHLVLLAISGTPPLPDQTSLVIPPRVLTETDKRDAAMLAAGL